MDNEKEIKQLKAYINKLLTRVNKLEVEVSRLKQHTRKNTFDITSIKTRNV